MKMILSILLILFSNILYAQENEVVYPTPDEELQQDEIQNPKSEIIKSDDAQVIKVECTCPENVQEQEADLALDNLFPKGSVFMISPESPQPVQKEEIPQKIIKPGYPEKLPKGYNDDSFKDIPIE